MPSSHQLPCIRRFAYGVGHILNDLCASIWFSYLLLFLHSIVQFTNSTSGILMLIGQVVDGVATPIIGFESDRNNGCCGYTKRKSWHLMGTICVALSFPFIFTGCIGCEHAAIWAQAIYFAAFIVIFQIGWAATQISHLSLIPELTPVDSERVELNAIRYAFTVISGLFVYCLAWLLLKDAEGEDLSPSNLPQFRTLGIISTCTGVVFSIMFHIGTKESNNQPELLNEPSSNVDASKDGMTWKSWLVTPQFYMMGLVYMFTRLAVNLSNIYLPMYIKETLIMSKEYLAVIPLVVFISGFLVSFLMRPANVILGKSTTYLIGTFLIGGSCTWMYYLKADPLWEVILATTMLGAGCSVILITSLAMTSDLIGKHSASGAFVYGAMSFTDKVANGIAIVVIQHMHPCKTQACCPDCVWYYRDTIAFSPSGACVCALIGLLAIKLLSLAKIGMYNFGESKQSSESKPISEEQSVVGKEGEECCNYLCCLRTSREAEAQSVQCSGEYDQPFSEKSFEDRRCLMSGSLSSPGSSVQIQTASQTDSSDNDSLITPGPVPSYGAI